MTVLLAIDAAWTETEPSGVALVASTGAGWRCLAAAPSYGSFFSLASGIPMDWAQSRFSGTPPEVPRLLEAARSLASAPVDLVTVDMPIATVPIATRRCADSAISRQFGRAGCSTHTPNSARPGPVGSSLPTAFADAGFPVAITATKPGLPHHLVEVYPHPALLSLLGCTYRVPYKVSKARRYWRGLNVTNAQRVGLLLLEFQRIYDALVAVFGPLGFSLPPIGSVDTLSALKRFEDTLDAVVCAWVGARYMEGEAVAWGDETAAIWCPR